MDFVPSTAKPTTRQVLGWRAKRVVFWRSIRELELINYYEGKADEQD